jgi:hypothetical protein
MKICTNHRNQNIEEVRAVVNEIRDAGNCPCCGFKYHTSKNSYFSSESPPLSWKKHDNCCNFSVNDSYLQYNYVDTYDHYKL